jgi:retron-type reverse transcriptase
MKLETKHIYQIKYAFERMQSKEDLLHLMNEVKPLIYGENVPSFKLKQLTWYANPKLSKNRYREFSINKKSGGKRIIHSPVKTLKALQKTINVILQCVFEPHKSATGFVNGKSIVDNAKIHVGSKYVYNIDLKDFFSGIDQARVWKTLQLKPFDLNQEKSSSPVFIEWKTFKKDFLKTDELINFFPTRGGALAKTPLVEIFAASNVNLNEELFALFHNFNFESKDFGNKPGYIVLVNKVPSFNRLEIANLIASLCCTEMEVERKNVNGEWEKVLRNVLPQGAPTSPTITNIICQKLDFLLSGVAKRFGLKYSRYADDITFSSMHNVYQPDSEFLKELHRIIAEQNFHIKETKTRLQKEGFRKEVTGLLVNDTVNVQKRYIKQLRMWLYYWERYGLERAAELFLQQYISDKGHVKYRKPNMISVISGKLEYLKMVKGVENEMYLKLKERFDNLLGHTNSINQILDIWKNDGINQAMKVYYAEKFE